MIIQFQGINYYNKNLNYPFISVLSLLKVIISITGKIGYLLYINIKLRSKEDYSKSWKYFLKCKKKQAENELYCESVVCGKRHK